MSSTTNILELPSEIKDNTYIKETPTDVNQVTSISTPGMNLDESTINQIVNGLQRASIAGATQLQSRDIPISASNISNDPQIQPNYLPTYAERDYIHDKVSNEILNHYNNSHNSDDIYNEFQTPFLLAVLYFLFQLPFLRKWLFSYMPFLFSKDGNMNLQGFIFNSLLFGITFYLLNKSTELFSRF